MDKKEKRLSNQDIINKLNEISKEVELENETLRNTTQKIIDLKTQYLYYYNILKERT